MVFTQFFETDYTHLRKIKYSTDLGGRVAQRRNWLKNPIFSLQSRVQNDKDKNIESGVVRKEVGFEGTLVSNIGQYIFDIGGVNGELGPIYGKCW